MSPVKFPISVVVIAKNEEANIRRCVEALTWCEDVVVIDDQSVDDTARLAADGGARVLTHGFESFARQRNWALDHAALRHDWALMLDADEVVTAELQGEIERVVPAAETNLVGFRMCRKTMLMGKWLKYSDGFPVWIVRLVRVGRFRFEDSGHGEVPSRRMPCRSLLRFLYQYVMKGGFLDGRAGLTFSWLMAVYEGLIVLQRREMELRQQRKTP